MLRTSGLFFILILEDVRRQNRKVAHYLFFCKVDGIWDLLKLAFDLTLQRVS
jgi:hypothetical protein